MVILGADDLPTRALGSGLFWLGIAGGCLAGVAFEKMRSAWKSWQSAKKSVPKARKTAFSRVRSFSGWAIALGAAVVISMWWIAGGSDNFDTVPAQVPTPPSSSPSVKPSR